MKTNAYESAVIINAALDDEQIDIEVARIQENIINLGGKLSTLIKSVEKDSPMSLIKVRSVILLFIGSMPLLI